ncbi:MAG: hypothetical protein A2868_03390 [Candidatus Levybacteria bacterium RIFCSPHIGHO2_01_FULL_40_15b]|nr:MAG: hypothetical protein A2868_03390 [Candidatus Levybacteria bacterium RIFCSPHIGHO2_01_FULL_40_15b]
MLRKRQLEQIVRGFSNHRRIEMLDLIDSMPELSVDEISKKLNINFKTTSSHLRRLIIAGLIMKRSRGKDIRHKLSERGKFILTFLRTLE